MFWPDGKTLATASADQIHPALGPDGTLSPDTRLAARCPRPSGGSLGLALLPDLRTLVSVDKNGTFLSWDAQQARTDRTRLALASTNGWDTYRFSPDGRRFSRWIIRATSCA